MTLAERLVASTDVINRTGMSIDRIEPGKLHLRMPLDGNIGGGWIMYAGSVFALAEAGPGLLIVNRFDPARFAPTCAGVNIRFRRPAKSDVSLHLVIDDEQFAALEAEVMEKGKGRAEFALELVDHGGEVIALADVKYVIFKL